MKKIKRGHIFMLIGAVLIAGAVGLATYNHIDDKRAGQEAYEACDKLFSIIDENIKNNKQDGNESVDFTQTVIASQKEVRTEVIDGREFVGIVSIPAMKVELPVQSSCSDELLRYSPCCYKGNVYDGSMIIAAHNYTSHFGRLNTLKAGDKVTYTDVDGLSFNYKVIDVYQLDSTAIKEMEEQGEWDLTLFTCTYGNRQRVTVRCIRV